MPVPFHENGDPHTEGENTPSIPEACRTENVEMASATDQEKDSNDLATRQPKRVAALQARDKVKAWTTYESEND